MCRTCYDHESEPVSWGWGAALAAVVITVASLCVGTAVHAADRRHSHASFVSAARKWTVRHVSEVCRHPVGRAVAKLYSA